MKLSKKKTSKKHDVTHHSVGNWRKKLGAKYYGNQETKKGRGTFMESEQNEILNGIDDRMIKIGEHLERLVEVLIDIKESLDDVDTTIYEK